jgi:hypothetical protein
MLYQCVDIVIPEAYIADTGNRCPDMNMLIPIIGSLAFIAATVLLIICDMRT